MDVRTLCLGMLFHGEACGYELKKRFEELFSHFYSAGYGSIYPALADLADAGLVTCRAVPQEGRPDRKIYRITAAGRRQFLAVLHTAQPRHKLRSEFLATMYFAELMDPQRLAAVLEERLHGLREAERHIERIRSDWTDETPAGARFVAGFGAALAKVAADYIETHRHLLTAAEPESRRSAGDASNPRRARINVIGNRA